MNNEVQWFACLCIDSGLLTRQRLRTIRETLGMDVDLLGLGQHILDSGTVEDVDAVQRLLDEACDQVDAGAPPPYDPFAVPEKIVLPTAPPQESVPSEPAPVAPAPMAAAPVAPAPAAPAAPASPAPAAPAPEPVVASKLKVPRKPSERVVAANGIDAAPLDFASVHSLSEPQLRAGLIALLKHCVEAGSSDLHLSAGARPFERRDRENHYLSDTILTVEAARRLNTVLLSPEQIEYMDREQDFDFAIPFSTGERFRVNLMFHKDGMAGTYRIVPAKIQSLEELGFFNAEVIKKLLTYHNGLILITGPVGSGKTATLASLVHEMNNSREDHIITVEEPIEMVQVSNRCSITQRGVGPHTNSFHSALKGALRQDPDIIVIGEMRDLETIEMAISASETGHLVMGTMHTSDAGTTLNRILDVFPPAQQTQIRAMVAESLRGIICQRLLPGKDGGLVLACELLLKSTAVSALIREGKTQGLSNVMETGKGAGMIQMDVCILDLYRAGKITAEVARENIKNETIRVQVK